MIEKDAIVELEFAALEFSAAFAKWQMVTKLGGPITKKESKALEGTMAAREKLYNAACAYALMVVGK